METLWQDIRFGVRTLTKRPGFSTVVILTLALGIGVTTAIFSLIYGILLKPFPYRAPEQLVRIQSVNFKTSQSYRGGSLPDIEDWRRMNRTLEELGAYTTFDSDIRGDGPSEAVKLSQLNPQALSILGVTPIIGRMLRPEEDIKGGEVNKALISFRLWQQRFGSDPNILGRTVQTSINTFSIVGVMPPGFAFPEQTDLWTPMESWYAQTGRPKMRIGRFYPIIARLKPGVTLAQAESDLNNIAAALESQYPKDNEAIRVRLSTLRDAEVGNIRPYLLLLLAAVAFVLLICCANVANLLLVRATTREREMAVRAALGATRGRLIGQLLTESVLLAVVGGVFGIGLAYGGVALMKNAIPIELPIWMTFDLDWRVLLFALGVSLLTGLLFGLAPALQRSSRPLTETLKEGGRGNAGAAHSRRTRDALVVAEIALALILLTGAALMMRSFLKLNDVATGIDPRNLLALYISPPGDKYREEPPYPAYASLYNRILTRMRELPGVAAAGGSNVIPHDGEGSPRKASPFTIEGQTAEQQKFNPQALMPNVSHNYFEVTGIPLRSGRGFYESENLNAQRVAVISQELAKRFWPNEPPLGKRLKLAPADAEADWWTIIGVAGDVRYQGLDRETGYAIYQPFNQEAAGDLHLLVKTNGNPSALIEAARQAVWSVDPQLAIYNARTMETVLANSTWQRRLWGYAFAVFALLALALASVGIYGVMSYLVSQRTREIGIRIALGAQGRDVLRLVMGQGLRLVIIGVAIGLFGSMALTRVMACLLFGVSATDPLTFAGVAFLLILVALIACYLPAQRAVKVNPVIALRQE
jgi:putative ABC transport system permease protein